MVETPPAAVDLLLEPLAQHVAGVVGVDLLRSGSTSGNHLLVDGPVLGREELFVGDVRVGGVDALLLGVVERIDDHVVVQHLGLGGAVRRVELVLALGLGVGPDLIQPLPMFAAHQNDDGDDDDDWNDGRQGGDESHAAAVHVLLLVHPHNCAVRKDLAGLAGVTRQALALKVINLVNAEAVVHARGRVALVNLDGAVLAGESGLASTDEIVDGVVASSAVLARVATAVVDVLLAVGADEAGPAVALVVGDKVNAGAAISTGIDLTVVDVHLAVLSGEPDWAAALVVRAVGSQRAGGPVRAGGRPARVDLHVAVDTLEALGALAHVAGGTSRTIDALGSVLAGLVLAGLGPHLAMGSVEADWANASVVADPSALKSRKKDVNVFFSSTRNLFTNFLTMK